MRPFFDRLCARRDLSLQAGTKKPLQPNKETALGQRIEENVRAADIVLTAEDLAEIDRIVPPGAASGPRYPIGQMHRLNL
jgi:diketogulonate reductase-like aldo/keto reductase